MKFEILTKGPVNLDELPCRQATDWERRQMLGSLATVYEMKIPIVYCVGTKFFYPLDYHEETVVFPADSELVILKTDVTLPSIFRKMKKKKKGVSKKFQNFLDRKDGKQ